MAKAGVGNQVKDIFSRKPEQTKTTPENKVDRPNKAGRPKLHEDDVVKTMVTLREDLVIWIDRLSTDIRANTKAIVDRGTIIRAIIEAVRSSEIDLAQATTENEVQNVILSKLKGKNE